MIIPLGYLQPINLELNFFNRENRVLHYPVRTFYVDGANLMAHNLCTGADSIYKKLYTSVNFMGSNLYGSNLYIY